MARIKTRLAQLEKDISPRRDWCEVVHDDEPGVVFLRTWRDGVLVHEVTVRGCYFLPEFER